ncbi:hypothetical protein OPV22_004716 [Ensete ventricosum]|uniref:Uncharacterized protein n=1 Tax=Ensete ventricosum TaxID=4639 RepID=A0AAV8RB89_ENSVE|nr:hypothetical protein OPV22_004716 [Ensete ventricosum]
MDRGRRTKDSKDPRAKAAAVFFKEQERPIAMRKLHKNDLGGATFGCKGMTIEECLAFHSNANCVDVYNMHASPRTREKFKWHLLLVSIQEAICIKQLSMNCLY